MCAIEQNLSFFLKHIEMCAVILSLKYVIVHEIFQNVKVKTH